MKRIAAATVLTLVLFGCGGGEDTTTSTTSDTQTTTTTTTDASGTTSEPSTTTTTTTAATTTAPTTTVPVTSHPRLPSATSRSLIPWDQVGSGWHVVLYDAGDVASPTDGPVALYLVSPTGTRYEAASWPADNRPWAISDARPDGTAVIVESSDPVSHDKVWTTVDLTTGAKKEVLSAGFPEDSHIRVGFTRPTGLNLVIYRNDGTNEWIERRSTSGSVLATVYTQPVAGMDSLEWLYGTEGTTLLVQHHGGIAYLQNTGTLIRQVDVPADRSCAPLKWWGTGTFLASCTGGPAVAPHDYYHQLWILRTDGTAGTQLTSVPPGTVDIVDFGYTNAFQAGTATILQWSGDCSAGYGAVLQPSGLGTALSMPWLTSGGYRVTGVSSGQMGIFSWQSCGTENGALVLANTSGGFVSNLVPLVGTAMGVLSAIMLE